MAGAMRTSMRLAGHSMRLRRAQRSYLTMGSTGTDPVANNINTSRWAITWRGKDNNMSEAEQAKCTYAMSSNVCCSCSWLPSCQLSECYPVSHLVFRRSKIIALALTCGFGTLWLAGQDQGKLLQCDSSEQPLQAATGSTLMLYITKERAGFIDDACELLKSQAVHLKHYNVSVDLGRNTRHVYVVQDMATGGSLSEEKIASVRQVLMTLGEVTFVHSVPGKHVVIATPSGNRLVSIKS